MMFHRFWSDSIWCVSDPFLCHLHPWSIGQWVCVRFWGSVYGQVIATWAEVTPKGNFLRESYPKFRLRIYCKLQWIAQMYIYCMYIYIYKYIVRPSDPEKCYFLQVVVEVEGVLEEAQFPLLYPLCGSSRNGSYQSRMSISYPFAI